MSNRTVGHLEWRSGTVVLVCLTVLALQSSDADNPDRANSGRSPEAGFHHDLRDGYKEDAHWTADYYMDADWFATDYSPNNVVFDKSGLTLVLEKKRSRGHPFTGAEFQVGGFYGYGRYETVMKAPSDSGAVASFFTHTDGYFDDPHDEIDFEWLGRDPSEVHLNYFRDGERHGSTVIPLGFDASENFHLYAFEWRPDSIKWYVDGALIYEVEEPTAEPGIPQASGRVIANLWAAKNSTVEWTGPATFKTTTASYQCISHVPLGHSGRQCSDTYNSPQR